MPEISNAINADLHFWIATFGKDSERMRCAPCDVAWQGKEESLCWVCHEPGIAIESLKKQIYRLRFDDF